MATTIANGHASGSAMDAIFPEALKTLKEADPEVYGIIEDEKARQWWGPSQKFQMADGLAVPER